MSSRRTVLKSGVLAVSSALVVAAGVAPGASWASNAADEFPSRPTHLVVPYPPGGPTDTLARILAERVTSNWPEPVIVEYKPGAGTAIGVSHVARSKPDGYTFGVVNSAYIVNSLLREDIGYHPDQLTGITQMVYVPLVMVANVDAPYDNIEELVAYARENPGTLSYATPGAGGTSHLAGELLNREAGIDLLHIAYKGSAPAHTDVVGGRVPLMIDPLLSATPLVESGRLKFIAILSEERFPGAPDIPTVSEVYPGFDVSTFLGLVAPKDTPKDVVVKIADAFDTALKNPEDRKRIDELGMAVVASGPEKFNQLLKDEAEMWQRVIKEANITVE